MNHEKIKDFLENNGADYMSFKFKRNPPASSHMGGVWERQIRSMRMILSSLMRNHGLSLSGEAFRTFMADVSAVLNSQPLTVDNLSNPNDPPLLCPSQLITVKSKVILPPPGQFLPEDIYSRRQWRRIQHLASEFWTRWRKEYLQSLQIRSKWNNQKRNLKQGDTVLLVQDNAPSNCWPKAQVITTCEDEKGLVRSVKIQVSSKSGEKGEVLERPIHKLVLLYGNEDE